MGNLLAVVDFPRYCHLVWQSPFLNELPHNLPSRHFSHGHWNIREGLVPERDDILPERVFTEPLTLGPKAGTAAAIYDRKKFEEDKQRWYKARGCDTHGIPTDKTLRKLDLAFVVPGLEEVANFEKN